MLYSSKSSSGFAQTASGTKSVGHNIIIATKKRPNPAILHAHLDSRISEALPRQMRAADYTRPCRRSPSIVAPYSTVGSYRLYGLAVKLLRYNGELPLSQGSHWAPHPRVQRPVAAAWG